MPHTTESIQKLIWEKKKLKQRLRIQAQLNKVDFSSSGSTLKNIDFSGCTFKECNFSYQKFIDCNFTDCTFEECITTGVETVNCINSQVIPQQASVAQGRLLGWGAIMAQYYPKRMFQYKNFKHKGKNGHLTDRWGLSSRENNHPWIYVRKNSEESQYGHNSWVLNVSVKPGDVEKAFNVLAPIILKYCPIFKVIDTNVMLKQKGGQFTIPLQFNRVGVYWMPENATPKDLAEMKERFFSIGREVLYLLRYDTKSQEKEISWVNQYEKAAPGKAKMFSFVDFLKGLKNKLPMTHIPSVNSDESALNIPQFLEKLIRSEGDNLKQHPESEDFEILREVISECKGGGIRISKKILSAMIQEINNGLQTARIKPGGIPTSDIKMSEYCSRRQAYFPYLSMWNNDKELRYWLQGKHVPNQFKGEYKFNLLGHGKFIKASNSVFIPASQVGTQANPTNEEDPYGDPSFKSIGGHLRKFGLKHHAKYQCPLLYTMYAYINFVSTLLQFSHRAKGRKIIKQIIQNKGTAEAGYYLKPEQQDTKMITRTVRALLMLAGRLHECVLNRMKGLDYDLEEGMPVLKELLNNVPGVSMIGGTDINYPVIPITQARYIIAVEWSWISDTANQSSLESIFSQFRSYEAAIVVVIEDDASIPDVAFSMRRGLSIHSFSEIVTETDKKNLEKSINSHADRRFFDVSKDFNGVFTEKRSRLVLALEGILAELKLAPELWIKNFLKNLSVGMGKKKSPPKKKTHTNNTENTSILFSNAAQILSEVKKILEEAKQKTDLEKYDEALGLYQKALDQAKKISWKKFAAKRYRFSAKAHQGIILCCLNRYRESNNSSIRDEYNSAINSYRACNASYLDELNYQLKDVTTINANKLIKTKINKSKKNINKFLTKNKLPALENKGNGTEDNELIQHN